MAQKAQGPCAKAACRLDAKQRFAFQNQSMHKARKGRDRIDADGQDRPPLPAPHHGHQHKRQQGAGKGHQPFDGTHHDAAVNALDHGSAGPQHAAAHRTAAHRYKADQQNRA